MQRASGGYPWIKYPAFLPDNYFSALATLRNTERTLRKDPQWAQIYSAQIQDMVDRRVARKLSREQMKIWSGPVFYVSHLAVKNAKFFVNISIAVYYNS